MKSAGDLRELNNTHISNEIMLNMVNKASCHILTPTFRVDVSVP